MPRFARHFPTVAAALFSLAAPTATPLAQAQASATQRLHYGVGIDESSNRHDAIELGGNAQR